jgi:uncharacterized damage-inducible protein DinB
MITTPQPHEYSPFAANYVKLASEYENVIELLRSLKDSTHQFLVNLPVEKAEHSYAPGKWTIKQLVGHMIDTERIFAYRAFCISRGEKQVMPGFEQDDYVNAAESNSRTLQSLAEEFKSVRQSNLYFIDTLTDEQISNVGNVSDYHPTVRALLYMMAGHELYHLQIIRERYLTV